MKPRLLTEPEGHSLKRRLNYDPDTGSFVWRRGISGKIAGTTAGTHCLGYIHIMCNGRTYKAHRLAWFFVHGYWPKNEIDHINGDKADNRIINLRETTRAQSMANIPLPINNTSGMKGVTWHKKCRRWVAQIRVNNQHVYLGSFKSKEEATWIREQAEEKYHGEFRYRRDQMTDKTKLKMVLKGKSMTDPKIDKVTETYIKIRDARSVLKKEYEAKDLELKAQLETLDAFFLETLQTLGVESMRTAHGTVYQSTSIKPSCMDWNAFYTWIAEHEAFDALEKRVKKTFIVDYMKDNSGELPPGIAVLQEYEVTVRRS
jgi:HNH endonuclease